MKIKFYLHSALLITTGIASLSYAQTNNTSSRLKSECSNAETPQSSEQIQGTISDIDVDIHPIFDEDNPDENIWLFRLVNFLHIDTHKNVVKRDVLQKEGDPLDEKLLAESERTLRTRRYLNGATITHTTDCNHRIHVKVDTREVWTMFPQIKYSHTGGKSTVDYGFHDSNFLGLGKTINITHIDNTQRSGDLFEYRDPNTGYGDTNLILQYADNSDGLLKTLRFTKPFASYETPWSSGVSYQYFLQEDSLYNQGKEADRFGHENSSNAFYLGSALSFNTRNSIHRILAGYSTQKDSFFPVTTPTITTNELPEDREFTYPWIEYQHIHDRYIETNNIQQINRIEDFNLGGETRIRLGYTSSPIPEYDQNTVFEAEYQQGVMLSDNQLLLGDISTTGMYDGAQLLNTKIALNSTYHWKNFRRGQFFIGVRSERGFHLFQDAPLELGGDTGLRGYPERYQAGDRLQLITVEQRFFGKKEWFSLFHIGAAVFVDEGKVWGNSAIPQLQQSWLGDVGIGLRISGTRTGSRDEGAHNILHIDIATPLNGDKDLSKFQWIVKVKKSF